MIVFPDSNAQTEYTDPNGVDWVFDGTGWVKQCDCPDGGGGNNIGTDYDPDVPLNFEAVGRISPKGSVINAGKLASPLCFGDDIYFVWWTQSGNVFSWERHESNGDGTFTYIETGSADAGRSYGLFTQPVGVPWNIVYKNYAFRSYAGGQGESYIKQNEDKSLSFGNIADDLGWSGSSGWFGFNTRSEGCFLTSNDKLCFLVKSTNNDKGGFCTLEGNASGGLDRWRDVFVENEDSRYNTSFRVAVTEADYGHGEPAFFYLQTGVSSSTTTKYNFVSVDPVSRSAISRRSATIQHDESNTNYPGIPVRYKNNRGAMWIGGTQSKRTTIAAPMVSETGVISLSLVANSSLGYFTVGSSGAILQPSDSSYGIRGIGETGSTCGLYIKQNSKWGSQAFPVVPMVITGMPVFAGTSKQSWGSYQIQSSQIITCSDQWVSENPIVRAGSGGYWMCNVSNTGSYYLWKASEEPTAFEINQAIAIEEERKRLAETEDGNDVDLP